MTAEPRMTVTPWYGPASVVGVLLGVLLWALPYAFTGGGGLLWVWLLPPVVGGVLMAVRGTPRRVGVGLVASCLTLPVGLLAFGVLGFTV